MFFRFLSRSRTKPTETSADEYLVGAAQFISKAQTAESEGSYELSFTCYKSAVNLLLQGWLFGLFELRLRFYCVYLCSSPLHFQIEHHLLKLNEIIRLI